MQSESLASRHQQGGNHVTITPARQLFLQYQELVDQLEHEVNFFFWDLFSFLFFSRNLKDLFCLQKTTKKGRPGQPEKGQKGSPEERCHP